MSQLFKNNAKTRLASALGASDLSFTVTTGEGALFPAISDSDFFFITLEDSSGNKEIVRVTGRSSDVFTISSSPGMGRAQDGTIARAFNANDLVELRLTAGFIDALKEGSLMFSIDGGGSAISTGIKGFIEAPFNGTIKSVRLFADVTGDISIDIFKDTYNNYNPDINPSESICAGSTDPISITGGIKQQRTGLVAAGWTVEFSKGDIFYFEVVSCNTITKVTISMTVERY